MRLDAGELQQKFDEQKTKPQIHLWRNDTIPKQKGYSGKYIQWVADMSYLIGAAVGIIVALIVIAFLPLLQ